MNERIDNKEAATGKGHKNNPVAIRVTCAILGTLVSLIPVFLLVEFWDDLVEYAGDAIYSIYVFTGVPLIAAAFGLVAAYLFYLAARKKRIVRRRFDNALSFKILSGAGIATCAVLAVVLVVFFRHDIAGFYDTLLIVATSVLMVAIVVPFALYYGYGFVRKKKTRKAVAYSIATVAILVGLTIGLTAFEGSRYVPTQRGPYLSWSDDPRTSMTVSWQSPLPSPRVVQWSNTSDFSTVNDVTASETNLLELLLRYYYNATITGLEPNTTYWYRIPGFHDEITNFTTAPDETVPFSFFAYGDNREATIVGSTHKVIVELMQGLHQETPHSLVINSGDITNDWDTVHSWDIHFHVIKPIASRMPYFVASGNHEWKRGAADLDQPHNMIHEIPPEPDSFNQTSFAFQYSNAYFIMLGYSHAEGRQEEVRTWLRGRLEHANSSLDIDWVFLSWHVPPFGAARGRGDNNLIKNNTCTLLHEFDVDVVFLGHDHNYQRINITHTSNYSSSVQYIITGGGGASLRDIEEPDKTWDGTDETGIYGEKFHGQLEIAESVHHFMSIHVDGNNATFTAIRTDGSIIEQFSLVK